MEPAAHAIYQVTPNIPTGDERHNKASQAHRADSLKESQLAAGRGAFTSRRTSPTRRIQTASLTGAAAVLHTRSARIHVGSSRRCSPNQVAARATSRPSTRYAG